MIDLKCFDGFCVICVFELIWLQEINSAALVKGFDPHDKLITFIHWHKQLC
jgi:hypothetical protein